MNEKQLFFLGLIALLLVIVSYQAYAFNLWEFLGFTNDEPLIGYEVIDGTTHIWNNGTLKQDYYYTGLCNAQISNIPDEQWEYVTLGLTYGDTSQDLINNYVELHTGGCARIEHSDFQTYVNITAYKYVSYLGKSGILAKNSYIELNDNMITETFYFKSKSNIDTNIWFVLKRNNIDIGVNGGNDYVEVIDLDGTVEYLNLTKACEDNLQIIRDDTQIFPELYLSDYDTKENIAFIVDTNTEFKFMSNNGNIFTAFNARTFRPNQVKTLETYWIDADGEEMTYNFEVDTLGYEFESSISADSLGTAIAKIIDIFKRGLNTTLTIDDITFTGVNNK